MNGPLHIAVDLGAGSGRVFLVGFDPDEFFLEETHRFRYPPYFDGELLRWNFNLILEEVKAGSRKAGIRATGLGRRIVSIGVDSWAVDYGLVGANGRLIADPVCYRDSRTDKAMERVFAMIPREEIFENTGIQFQKFNTLYQFFSEGRDRERVSMLLLLPDLINYMLTGSAASEYTNATTTQMVNAATGDWDRELLDRLELPSRLLQNIVPTGRHLGTLLPEIAKETELNNVAVIASATHDTACAVAAAPMSEGGAYVSSGTWSLIGVELDRPMITRDALHLNFTNEGGAYGTFRFLKNVMGLWIFESCKKEWEAVGSSVEYENVIEDIAAISGFTAFIFPDDKRFFGPESMLEAINTQLSETGSETAENPTVITKIIFDSLAFRYASVLRSIESLTGTSLERIEILGGGGRNRYLNQMTANTTGLPVRSGLTEATVVGNALVQAIASGRFASLSEGRAYVASNVKFEEFNPELMPGLAEAEARYQEVEGRFQNAAAQASEAK